MAKYRKICPKIWNDSKFMRLSNDGKLAFFYMLTHPAMTSVGGLRGKVEGLALELDSIDPKAFHEAFREGMAVASDEAPLIWFPRFIKYHSPESPNVVKSWVKSLDDLPECELKNTIISEAYKSLEGLSESFREAFREAFA